MADRRMFHRQVVQSDAFLDMSIGAQALYFQMGMMADDDGFVAGPRQAARMVGVGSDELEELIDRGFLLRFDGIVVLTHWRMANSLKSDRLQPPRYPQIAQRIYMDENRRYTQEHHPEWMTLLENRQQQMKENGIRKESQKRRKEKKREEKKIKEDNLEEGSAAEPLSLPFPAEPGCSRPDEIKPAPMYGLLGQGVVMLSEREKDSLLDLLGLEDFDKYVRKLSGFILANNAKIKDHYATILKWWEEDKIV